MRKCWLGSKIFKDDKTRACIGSSKAKERKRRGKIGSYIAEGDLYCSVTMETVRVEILFSDWLQCNKIIMNKCHGNEQYINRNGFNKLQAFRSVTERVYCRILCNLYF